MTDDLSKEAASTLRRLRHDMRTSLGQILGYSEMLQEEAEDRELTDMIADLGKIHGSATKLLELVDEIFQPTAATVPSEGSAEPDQAVEAAEPADPTVLPNEVVGASGNLLVVDDDENNRDMLVRRLGKAGYTITTAENGEQALEAIENTAFDLALVDVMMPGIDGFEVLARLRKSHPMARLPVIMATALTDTDDIVKALRLGANDYVGKPFDLPVVMARVATQLTAKRAWRLWVRPRPPRSTRRSMKPWSREQSTSSKTPRRFCRAAGCYGCVCSKVAPASWAMRRTSP